MQGLWNSLCLDKKAETEIPAFLSVIVDHDALYLFSFRCIHTLNIVG